LDTIGAAPERRRARAPTKAISRAQVIPRPLSPPCLHTPPARGSQRACAFSRARNPRHTPRASQSRGPDRTPHALALTPCARGRPASPSIREGERLLRELTQKLQSNSSEQTEKERRIFRLEAELKLAKQRTLVAASGGLEPRPTTATAQNKTAGTLRAGKPREGGALVPLVAKENSNDTF
jgi:hypothetical protein